MADPPVIPVSIFAPATVSNVGPGFDCFGLALEQPGDTVSVRPSDVPGIRVEAIEGKSEGIPLEAERNTAAVAAATVWNTGGDDMPAPGLVLRIDKGIPPGSGLGSSGASAAAGAAAAMHLLADMTGRPVDDDLMLAAALDGEAAATGARHADNVAPALRGGFVIVRGGEPPAVARFHPKLECWLSVVKPSIAISTREARAVLPESVPLADAVVNWSNCATLVLGLLTGDPSLVRQSIHDTIVQPCRAKLIPGFDAARDAAMQSGALACGVSGSGPTIFTLATLEETAVAAGQAVSGVFRGHGLDAWSAVSPISRTGARRL